MFIRKIIFSTLIFLVISINLFAQSNNSIFEIQTEAIIEFDLKSPGIGYQMGNYILINGSFDFQYNVGDGSIKKMESSEISSIRGRSENELIIGRVEDITEQDFILYLYDPAKNSYMKLENILVNKNRDEKIDRIFHYKDSEYIVSYAVYHQGPVYYNTYLINSKSGEIKLLMNFGKTYAISPDKMNLLLANYNEKYFGVYNIKKDKMISRIEFLGDPIVYFINNEYFFKQKSEGATIFNLYIEKTIELNYLPPKDVPNISISLFKVLNSQYGYYTQVGTGKRVLVKMPCENEIYTRADLLFHPTTATLNDDRVRMREWPLLDAKHLAFLEEGEEVKVLDKSGIKVKIDDMEDYWYKIKRSDGQIGWSYGVFLEIAKDE